MSRSIGMLFLSAVTLCLASCTTRLSKPAENVKLANDEMVAGCDLLGVVSGSSGWGNLAASAGQVNARNEAQERAARLGATHLVWIAVAGGYSPSASAYAYDCKNRSEFSAAPNPTTRARSDLESRLTAIKDAFEKGLITQEEYDETRAQILKQF